jgi:hypothetical protein
VGQTIGLFRLSTPGLTGSKKHGAAVMIDDDRRQKTIICPTSGGSFHELSQAGGPSRQTT